MGSSEISHRRLFRRVAVCIAALLLLAACSNGGQTDADVSEPADEVQQAAATSAVSQDDATAIPETTEPQDALTELQAAIEGLAEGGYATRHTVVGLGETAETAATFDSNGNVRFVVPESAASSADSLSEVRIADGAVFLQWPAEVLELENLSEDSPLHEASHAWMSVPADDLSAAFLLQMLCPSILNNAGFVQPTGCSLAEELRLLTDELSVSAVSISDAESGSRYIEATVNLREAMVRYAADRPLPPEAMLNGLSESSVVRFSITAAGHIDKIEFDLRQMNPQLGPNTDDAEASATIHTIHIDSINHGDQIEVPLVNLVLPMDVVADDS